MLEHLFTVLADLFTALAEGCSDIGQRLRQRADRLEVDRRMDMRRRTGVEPWQTRSLG